MYWTTGGSRQPSVAVTPKGRILNVFSISICTSYELRDLGKPVCSQIALKDSSKVLGIRKAGKCCWSRSHKGGSSTVAGQQLQDLGSVRRPSKGQLVWMDVIINYLTYNFKERFPHIVFITTNAQSNAVPRKIGTKNSLYHRCF